MTIARLQDIRLIYKVNCFPMLAMNKLSLKIKLNTICTSTPKMTCIGKILTKYIQDLHEDNHKILMSKIKEELINGKIVYVHG